MDNEIWKAIPETNGLYQVSNQGRVKNRKTGRILKPGRTSNNRQYLSARLRINKQTKYFYVHILVAKQFPEICGEWFSGAVVNHKDCNPSNNNASNLEWVTQKYNVNYKDAQVKRVMARYPMVLQYDTEGNFINKWISSYEVERVKGWSSSSITACARGEIKASHGFVWKYEEK